MRIISVMIALPVLAVMFFPHGAIAADLNGTNETQINFKINQNFSIVNGFLVDNTDILSKVPYNFPEYEPIKSPEELKREKMLARYADKIKTANFPEGKFVINASAYTAAADECGKSDGITASGLKVKENHTIACPPQFPLGTKLKIEGYGTYVCEDRGGAIKGNHIDIYMQTKSEAFAFGRKNLVAEVIL